MNVLIVEDEINACEYLRTLLSKLRPNYSIIDHLDSVQDTINWLQQNPHPDLILLDIQLSDGISFELFNHIEIQSPIIFTTAYDQFALQAFKVNSIDYLLKPISQDELLNALVKFETQRALGFQANKYSHLLQSFSTSKKNRCLVKKGNHFEFISVDDIAFIHSDDGLTFLYTTDKKRHLYTKSIQYLIDEIDESIFFQINRKQIININSIGKIHPFLNQRLKVELTTSSDLEFIVSRARMTEFKAWIDS